MKRAIEPSVRSQKSALILIDVINALDFEGSESLVHAAEHAARAIESLAARARAQGLPVIYVNDNFGQWRSDFMKTIEVCSTDDKPGHNVSRRLRPHADYFVLKPMHSSFFCTPFELVLRKLEVTRLILCGFATDLCLLFTAHDAHMRGFALTVPHDCSAANSEELHRRALVS